MTAAPSDERPRELRATLTVPVAVAAVFLVAGVVQLTRQWPAVGDFAVAELIVRHAARHLPLSGPYSAERGYNHPLPWVYVIQWLPYHLFGSRSSAAPATALWWNGAGASFVIWLAARRRAMFLGLLAVAALLLMARSVDGVVLLMPWNPNLAVVPAFVLLFTSWRVALGEARWLPLSVGLAVWSAGAHLGFLPFAVGLVAVSSIALVVATLARSQPGPRAHALRSLIRPILGALAVALVLVTPMLIDVGLHGSHSNPEKLLQQTGPGARVVPAREAVKVLRAELAIRPAWTRSAAPYDVYLYHPPPRAPWLLAVIVVVVIAAWRRRARDELMGIAVCLAALGVTTLGLMHVADTMLEPWYVLPAHIAGAGVAAFTVWSGTRSVGHLARRWTAQWETARPNAATARPLITGGRIALPLLCAVGTTVAVANMRTPAAYPVVFSTTERLAATIEQRVPKGTHLLVDAPIGFDGFFSQSLTLQLDKAGYDVRVPTDDLFMYTPALAVPPGWVGTTLTIEITGSPSTPPRPGEQQLARIVIPENVSFAGRTLSVWRTPSP